MPVMPDVTDVPVSPSSVVTEFSDGFSCCLDWEFVETQSFSFSQSCTVTQEEMWFERTTSESASAIKKKNDAAHTIAKFVLVI